jgi:S-adenosylmethionine:tRNA ribosyltransferase-isomerase
MITKITNLKTYDFNLPKELIAQKPVSPPDKCRLLVLAKKKKNITDDKFLNLPNYLNKGDVLVFNNSKVIPARLIGRKITGGKVEILLLRQIKPNIWECLVGNLPIKKQLGTNLLFAGSQEHLLLAGKIISRAKDTAQIKFNLSGQKLMIQILKLGQMPTPPYIKRIAKANEYQTFFAKELGSVAAPTAGLHFTPRMFKKLKQKGIQIEFVTLHVGLGTFQPIKVEDITRHQIHAEYFELDKQTAKRLNQAKKENRRIIAVGTTSVRVLESCASPSCHGEQSRTICEGVYSIKSKKGRTDIYIYPGYKFKFVDALITNFHLPKSSLLLLVSAFASSNLIKKSYQHAISKKYRFYSFGDVMLIK